MSLLVGILALVLSAPSAAPPAEARASVDHAVATTGDIITYTVEVEHAKDVDVELPEPGAQIAGLRIIDSGHPRPEEIDGRVHDKQWFKLRADLVGSYVLPPLKARYHQAGAEAKELATSEIFIEVKSVLPADGEATDIHDVKPLQKVHYTPRWLYPAIGLTVLTLCLAAVALWRRQRKVVPSAPPKPPHEVAFAALDALRRTDFNDPTALRAYYFDISEVVRTYVEGRFGLNATDLTTEEILSRLSAVSELDAKERLRLAEFLHATDSVKYAGYAPSKDEIAATYERALSFVEGTRPQPQAAAVNGDTPTGVAA